MTDKQITEKNNGLNKKTSRGTVTANAGKPLENYQATAYTPAGDRITPYAGDEDLIEKGNIEE